MKFKRALLGFLTLTALYLGMLLWVDARNQVFTELPKVLDVLPTLAGLALLSFLLRYLRWRWLLWRSGHNPAWLRGFLAYLSGFAFTATPGKVGELVRIRYFQPMGVAPARVVAAFVYERAVDLICVLVLSSLAIVQAMIFAYAALFVLILLSTVLFVSSKPRWLRMLAAWLRSSGLKRLARLVRVLGDGLDGCRVWMTPLDALVSCLLGLLAWSCIAFSFVWLLSNFNIAIPILSAWSIYPASMLAGAASMLPGGIGSTEITMVSMLAVLDVPLELAALAAIAIRVSTLWFAMVCGFLSLGMLEVRSQ